MDMSQLKTDKTPPIAKVGDEVVHQQEFQTRLQQIQQAQAGANLTDVQNAQMRQELLNQFIQERLVSGVVKKLDLVGSDAELWSDLIKDPIPGVEKAPVFQTVVGADTTFDIAKYREWLDTAIAGTISDPQLVQYREYLRSQKIPQRQLQVLVTAGNHPSTLEAKWSAMHRETRFKLWVAQAAVDSFPAVTPDSASIDAYFKASPDSFFIPKDLAKVQYVALPIRPSLRDEQSSREWAQMMVNQLKDGADFAELAKLNSEDQESSEKGGVIENASVWGPVFVQAVATLDSGKITETPVRTSAGWQIAQALGKTGTGDSIKIKVRHILVKVSASTETVDSLSTILKSIKEDVDAGKSFAEVAKAAKLDVATSEWFSKGDEIPGLGYIQGLSSYSFRNPEMPKNDDKASAVLQNKQVVALFLKSDSLKAGSRDLTPFRPYIASILSNKARTESAKQYLQGKMGAIQALVSIDSTNRNSIPKLVLDTVDNASFEGFVPGLGYATPALYKTLSSQKAGNWGTPVDAGRAVVVTKIIAKSEPDAAALPALISAELSSGWQYGNYSAFNEYIKNLQESTKIINNLDLYFAE